MRRVRERSPAYLGSVRDREQGVRRMGGPRGLEGFYVVQWPIITA